MNDEVLYVFSFYIILRGSVSIYINQVITDAIEDEGEDTQTTSNNTGSSLYNEKEELDDPSLATVLDSMVSDNNKTQQINVFTKVI